MSQIKPKPKLIFDFPIDAGLRQERPAHLHPESIYQAMRERGRAIPATPTVPIVERKTSPSNPPPRIVDGRVSYDFDLQLIYASLSVADPGGGLGVALGDETHRSELLKIVAFILFGFGFLFL